MSACKCSLCIELFWLVMSEGKRQASRWSIDPVIQSSCCMLVLRCWEFQNSSWAPATHVNGRQPTSIASVRRIHICHSIQATGESIWGGSTESYELHACAIDADDNVVAAGLAVGDGLTVDAGFATKVDGDSGEPIWTWQDDTNEFNEVLLGVALDEEGNAYVAGGEGVAYVDGVQIGNSSVVVKIDGSTGREIWRFSGGPTNGGSIFSSVAVDDATETVIAAGVTGGVWYPLGKSEGQLDFLAVALNATTGQELGHWQGGTSRQDVVDFAGFDSRGGLYLGGYSEGLWAAVSSASSDGSGEVEVSSGGITLVKFEPPGYGAEVDEAWSTTIVGLCVALAMGLLVLLSCKLIRGIGLFASLSRKFPPRF